MTTPWKSSGTSMTSSSTGSMRTPSIFLGDDLRPRHLQLEALAPHHLDQDRQLQLAAADDLHLLRRVGILDAERHVAEQLLARAAPAGCATSTYWPSRPAIGDVLTPKIIDTVGSSTAIGGIATRCSASAIVSPMVMSSMPARQTMSPAAAVLDVHALQPLEGEELGDLRLLIACHRASAPTTGSPTLTGR